MRVRRIQVEESGRQYSSEASASQYDIVERPSVGLISQGCVDAIKRLIQSVTHVPTGDVECERGVLRALNRDHSFPFHQFFRRAKSLNAGITSIVKTVPK